jgi:AcrR family transcriptional regulator
VVHIVFGVRKDAIRNRDRIEAVARRLIALHGADVSMEALAAAAGVAVGTIYGHYPTKAALVAAALEFSVEEIGEMALAADEAIASGCDVHDELSHLLRGIADRGSENRALRAAAHALGVPDRLRPEEEPPPPDSPMADLLETMDRVVDAARGAGVLRADSTRLDIAVLLRGVLDFELDERSRARYVEIILDGLRPAED